MKLNAYPKPLLSQERVRFQHCHSSTITFYDHEPYPMLAHLEDTQVSSAIPSMAPTIVARQLPNGWGYRIATQVVEAPDGTVYEGIGIPPSTFIQNTLDDIEAKKDRVLEKALELLQ